MKGRREGQGLEHTLVGCDRIRVEGSVLVPGTEVTKQKDTALKPAI